MNSPAIITIAYNRPDSLSRLLKSLDAAVYPEGVNVPLIISIDKSDSDAVVKVAEGFDWKHGDKIVMARQKRMGLREHVLACGDLTKEYGRIIVLEDDLYVSPAFYDYAVAALDFAEGDERIGGISLYNHLFNVHARKSFAAIDDGYDNWYFQFASSWGQAYTKKQWSSFRDWYELHSNDAITGCDVPINVASWSDKSWLKYYITYLIRTDKYFIYPRMSLTTNFGDVGSHAVKADADLQVPMAGERKRSYLFSKLEKSNAVYDAFFENKRIIDFIDCNRDVDNDAACDFNAGNLIVDLYASKQIEEICVSNKAIKYILTSRCLPYRIVNTFGRQMRPVDANIRYKVSGEDYYLYDITQGDKAPVEGDKAVEYLYEYRGISAKQMMDIIRYRVKEALNRK